MKSLDPESRMRELEYFHSLRLLPQTWVVLRLDGRGFSRFTESRFDKPFDHCFHDLMTQTAQALLEEMQGLYAYTESDEISVLFAPDWDFFDRELEKIISISASIATATFTHASQTMAHFDSRVWLGADPSLVVDYFQWRQDDAARCALNGWCYWTLRQNGKSRREATQTLEGKGNEFKNELLFQHGINFNEVPTWQRRGTGLFWESFEKEGYNPIRDETVTAIRRRIRIEPELPMKDDYRQFIQNLLKSAIPNEDKT